MQNKYLSIQEIHKETGYTITTISNYVGSGNVPHKLCLYKEGAIDAINSTKADSAKKNYLVKLIEKTKYFNGDVFLETMKKELGNNMRGIRKKNILYKGFDFECYKKLIKGPQRFKRDI